jgi:hypothetical protein
MTEQEPRQEIITVPIPLAAKPEALVTSCLKTTATVSQALIRSPLWLKTETPTGNRSTDCWRTARDALRCLEITSPL